MRLLTQTDLAHAQCSTPGCDHSNHPVLFIVSRCHPGGGVAVAYDRRSGHLIVSCHTCEGYICDVLVSPSQLQ
jgi:hypothetical protein